MGRQPYVCQPIGEESRAGQMMLLEIPRERLERALGSAKLYESMPLAAGQGGVRLARNFLEELVAVHESLDASTAARMASIGVDLLIASIAEALGRDTPGPLHGTLLVQRAKAYIEAHLGDHTLDPPSLAAAMGVSVRHLQQLFHERGRDIADWIWERRLAVAAEHLRDPGRAHMQIGAIAFGCGFVSQAHFSNRFRARFDKSPREYRRGTVGS